MRDYIKIFISSRFNFPQNIMATEKNSVPRMEKQEDYKVSLLNLPEWALDCILLRLSPQDLCRIAQVCTCLRNKSRSDHFWEKQITQKWGRLLGDVALQEWQWHTTKITNVESLLLQHNQDRSCGTFSGVWPFLCLHSYLESYRAFINLIKNCSQLALFICIETSCFWFPAQVHKNTRLALYCYDALISYNSRTDTFQARLPASGWRMIEGDIQWDRLRLPQPGAFAGGYYKSSHLNDLKPGDHIEIQKRRRKEFPYDWWFAVVGHLESCDEDVNHCRCQFSDMLVVEFKQYPHGSRFRRSVLNRNVDGEQGSRICWFGGIRVLHTEEEIEKWNNLFLSRN